MARHLALHRLDWAACLSAASFLHRGQDRFQLSVAELIMSGVAPRSRLRLPNCQKQ